MKLGQTTGTTFLTCIVNKGIESIILYTTSTLLALAEETINVQIQRPNGGNFDVTNGTVKLLPFLLASTFEGRAFTSFGIYKTVAVIPLTEFGAVHLNDNDVIKIELNALNEEETYLLDGEESPMTSMDLFSYELKPMNTEYTNTTFDTKGFDICVINDDPTIEEINYTTDNNQVVKYTPRELRALTQDADPVAQITETGVVKSSFAGWLQLPLKGIDYINIRKTQGAIVNLFLRKDPDLTNQY